MRRVTLVLFSMFAVFAPVAASAQTPLATAFTYQGELASGGTPATGTFDLRFRLYAAATGGVQIASTLCTDNLAVANGRFAASLDFGAAAFAGQQRYLEIEVRQDTGLDCSNATGFTILTPRQELTAAPNATFAQSAGTATTAVTANNAASLNGQSPSFYQNAANLTGTLPSARLSGAYTGPLTLSNPANIFTGNGAAITNLSATNISSGVLDAARMPSNWVAGGDLSGFYPSPTINPGAVTLGKLDPSVQDVLSRLSFLTPAPIPGEAIAWGFNLYGATNVPALPPGVRYTALAGGSHLSVALRSDGTVVAWGRSDLGATNVPALPPGVTYTAVAAGYYHSLALRSDGTVVGWGNNGLGQTEIPALPPGVTYTAVAGGGYHSLAVRSDGMVAAWGLNSSGQTNVPALPPGVTYTAVAAGFGDSLALRSDGTVVAWGDNSYGQLDVPALPPGVTYTAVAARVDHSLALRSDGTVVAWGRSDFGATNVPALPPGVTYTAVAGGAYYSLALRSDGTVAAWGRNAYGETNVPALPPGVTYTALAAGFDHALALRSHLSPPSLGSTVGLSIGGATPPPATGGISVAGNSSFVAGVSIGGAAPPPATGGISVAGASSFGAGVGIGGATPPATGGISVTGDSSFAAGLSAASFAGSGGGLTNLNASNITSGTISDLRLSSNIPLKDAANAFTSTGTTTFAGRLVAGSSSDLTSPSASIVAVSGAFPYGLAHTDGTISISTYVGGSTNGGWIGTFTNHPFSLFVNNGSPSLTVNTNGSVSVIGSLSKGGGSFKIDHPLDPENKYLYHSFVESPDMMNIYNGNVTTDADGYATITMPDYFEALNRDFRYQLTVIDESDEMEVFLWAKVVREVKDNQFTLRSSRGNLKVSWQVTGIRKDAWAEKNRIPNSVDKVGPEKGKYLHPEAFGKPASRGMYSSPAPVGQVGSK
ncbi:MAG: hypothetical protein JSR77_05620 [Planctomycetes bacterium]|nr:hypothetical protein [Planctomycetota bacterium]